jgi:ABC-2 type transport system permease protein
VPGVLVLLVTIIGFILSGLNIVREKEIGTIEQINVTPIRKYQFIIGKLTPFWIIALFELAFGLTVGKLLFDIPIVGSLGLVFLVASVYLLVILGMGLFASTLANTQQQAMLISFFFMMIFILMSGLFTSIDSMPDWAQAIDRFNPVAYFIRMIRMILLKGSGFSEISSDLGALAVLAAGMLSLAVWRYRKTV